MQLIDLLYYPGKKILFEVLALKTNPTDTCYIPDNHCLKLKSVQDISPVQCISSAGCVPILSQG